MIDFNEMIGGTFSRDPDDMAVFLAASLRAIGVDATIGVKYNDSGQVIAIVVLEGETPLASFPCSPLQIPDVFAATLNEAVRVNLARGEAALLRDTMKQLPTRRVRSYTKATLEGHRRMRLKRARYWWLLEVARRLNARIFVRRGGSLVMSIAGPVEFWAAAASPGVIQVERGADVVLNVTDKAPSIFGLPPGTHMLDGLQLVFDDSQPRQLTVKNLANMREATWRPGEATDRCKRVYATWPETYAALTEATPTVAAS